jgi:hypothetical protein
MLTLMLTLTPTEEVKSDGNHNENASTPKREVNNNLTLLPNPIPNPIT